MARKAQQRQPRTFKVKISYRDSQGQLRIHGAQIHAIGAYEAADIVCERLTIENPGIEIVQRAVKLVRRNSVRTAPVQTTVPWRALPC